MRSRVHVEHVQRSEELEKMNTQTGKSHITNRWGKVQARAIAVEHFLVFEGRPGIAYSHQHQLTTHQGRLIATWSLGVRDEEGPGQDMVFATSDNQGRTWSSPRVIASAQPGLAAKTIISSSGLRSVGQDMIAYCAHWDRAPEGIEPDGFRNISNDPAIWRNVRTEARVSRDGGDSWSAPVVVAPKLTNYMTPFTTRSGRIILPGNLTFPWTDDPMGLVGWQWSGVPGLNEGIEDTFYNRSELNALAETDQFYDEACCYQLADGTLRAMLRNEHKDTHRLGVCESRDNGVTWTRPQLTDYTDAVCRSHFGRLPDGRFFGMSCPDPKRHIRTPAILALSNDGDVFDKHFVIGDEEEGHRRYDGLYKHGRYGYPFLHFDSPYAYVIYSINKEDIGVGRFRLDALG